MPFKDTEQFYGPLALPDGMSVTPTEEAPTGIGDVLGAAFRTENPVVSAATSFNYDPLKPFDPDYRPWDDVQGTEYEDYAGRFAGARDQEDVVAMKAQIDRERDDRAVLDAAGGLGVLSQMGAAVLSPSSLIPGGAVVKGAKGVSIARTGLTVAGSAAFAAALDETVLQGTQETRTATESAFAIGGSFVLGGVLGAAAGKLTANQFKAASKRVEDAITLTHEYDEALRSVGAAENRADLTLRREEIFQMVNRVPVLRGVVRSDPVLRAQLSPLREVRSALVDLVETPLQYAANDTGQSVRIGGPSVEARILDRERNELASALSVLSRSFSEYAKDGPAGTIGTLTAPVTTRFNNLMGKDRKLTAPEFMDEVGKAMRRGDKHPIPQIQSAADALRREIFDKIKDEATKVGIFDADLQVKNADSYFSRVYNTERIRRHFGDGTGDDIAVVLRSEFQRKRAEAEKALQTRLDDQSAETKDIAKATQRALDKQKSADEFYANATDAEIEQSVNDTVRSLLGLKPGQHSYEATLSSPTSARVLDVDDLILEPWLESNAEAIMSQYFRQMVPDIEITRRFGDAEMTEARTKITEEIAKQMKSAKSAKQKLKVQEEGAERLRDLEGMRDRLRNRYGVPDNPRSGWIQANRALRTVSYMGYLGGMMLSAIPDVAGVIGRGGIEGAFGTAATALTNPKKLGLAAKDMAEIGAAAEWWLNSRAMSMAEMFDPYGAGTKMERVLGQGARQFSIATGMIPWNVGWKTVGGAAVASKMSKAADAVRAGKATKKQLRTLAENGIEPHMAERIAKQIDEFGDKGGTMWLPRGQDWTDAEAFGAFRSAMNREFDLMVITPGQDKPLAFSTELGKFFLQFKSFAMSAHHRILLSGIQRADADVLAQVTSAILLAGLASNIKANLGGYEPKEGDAFWEDALDRSGLAGWLMEPYNAASALSGGRLSITGEPVSRFQARSAVQGLAGPSVDMVASAAEAVNAYSSGKASYRDVRKLMRPIPGNNIWWLLPMFRKVEDAAVSATGAKPRQ
ncbi:hypothetical protein [Ruegeria sp. EL01]|uniref:hypothetical protein n=1 Tax=Ruegeria sp. EL01 TaxID=2107578 RepID=UPI000EA80CF9|nr:hypothetical protein [Ruegeria sp. EL01]